MSVPSRGDHLALDRRNFLGHLTAASLGFVGSLAVSLPASRAQTAVPVASRTLNVYNASQLAAALASALPGDHIVLQNGVYSGSFTVNRSGSSDRPIVIRAANLGGARLTGPITLAGSDTWLYGVASSSDGAVMIRADRVHVLRNFFTGRRSIRLNRASYCKIGYNHFNPRADDPNTSWDDILLDLTNSDVSAGRTSRYNHIFRNYFTSQPASDPASYRNRNHGIYVATYELTNYPPTQNIIEFNLFAHDRLRPIYTKQGGNIIRFNTILASPNTKYSGMMCGSRHVGGDQWIGNYFQNDYGLIIHGPKHTVVGNTFANQAACGLYLMAGNAATKHRAATDCVAAGNNGRLVLGFTYYGGSGPFIFAERNRVEGHRGASSTTAWARNNTILSSTTLAVPAAAKLSPQSVGPYAA